MARQSRPQRRRTRGVVQTRSLAGFDPQPPGVSDDLRIRRIPAPATHSFKSVKLTGHENAFSTYFPAARRPRSAIARLSIAAAAGYSFLALAKKTPPESI